MIRLDSETYGDAPPDPLHIDCEDESVAMLLLVKLGACVKAYRAANASEIERRRTKLDAQRRMTIRLEESEANKRAAANNNSKSATDSPSRRPNNALDDLLVPKPRHQWVTDEECR